MDTFLSMKGGPTEQTKYMETKPFYDPPTLKMTMDAQLNHILANTTRCVLSKVQSSVTWIPHLQVSVDKPCIVPVRTTRFTSHIHVDTQGDD